MSVARSAAALLLVAALAGCLSTDDAFPKGAIVAYGDSYTQGTGAERSEAYPARLERAIGVPVYNAGVNGETALEGLERIERDVLRHEPRLVIVEFGVNEAFRGYPVDRALDGLDQILELLDGHGIQAILVGVHFWDFQEEFDEGLGELGRKYSVPVVLDVLRGVLDNEDLRSDRYHPNAAGYAVMEQRIRPTVQGVLAVMDG